MTEISLPRNAVAHTADEWSRVWRVLFDSSADYYGSTPDRGVLHGYEDELEVTAGSGEVLIGAGAALVNGRLFWSDAQESLTVDTPSASARTDRVVVRADWTSQTVRLAYLKNGSEGTGTPPALTQTEGTLFEIPLAQVLVSTGGGITATDERVFVGDTSILHEPRVDARQYVFIPAAAGLVGATAISGWDCDGIECAAGVDTSVYGKAYYPLEDASELGDLHLMVIGWYGDAASGDVYIYHYINWGAEGEDYNADSYTYGAVETLEQNELARMGWVSGDISGVAPGDYISMRFVRKGTDVLDTGGTVHVLGWLLVYYAVL